MTPQTTGRVVDAASGQPVAGATVGFRGYTQTKTVTGPDGGFKCQAAKKWSLAIVIPFEFTPCGGKFYVEADGYKSFELLAGPRVLTESNEWRDIAVPERVELKSNP